MEISGISHSIYKENETQLIHSCSHMYKCMLSEIMTSALPLKRKADVRQMDLGYTLPTEVLSSDQNTLNVSVIMLNRRTALLQWWPRNALIHKDIEIVFTPEFSNYKVVIGLVDPVGNTVELHDLKPYTYYQLDLRERHGQTLYASVNFSTAGNLWYLHYPQYHSGYNLCFWDILKFLNSKS